MADSVALENMMQVRLHLTSTGVFITVDERTESYALIDDLSQQEVDSEESSETMESTEIFTAASTTTTQMSETTEMTHSFKSMHSVETSEYVEAIDEKYEAIDEKYEANETSEVKESSEVVECVQLENSELLETTQSYQTSQRTESVDIAENGTLETSNSMVAVESSSSSTEKSKKKKSTKKSKKSSSSSSKSCKTSSTIQYSDSNLPQLHRVDSRNTKIHVRSVDAGQVQKKFNKVASENDAGASQLCKLCNKQVFQMERIKAERAVWHKNCFACSVAECGKKLTVDTYNSHEGKLYCKPHFKQLFQPKVVPDFDEPMFLKPELIIRESQPAELPDDVVRANESSSGYGIEELSNLDLKSRFSLFERGGKSIDEQPTREGDTGRSVKRSDSILSRLMRFDTDAAHRASQNLDLIDSSEEEGDSYDMDTIGNRRSLIRGDDSVSFGSISSIKSKWEDESSKTPLSRKEELARQRKEEIQVLRARQCHGRQLRLKEAYEQAVLESKDKDGNGVGVMYDPDKVRLLKEVFERSLSDNNGEEGHQFREDFHGHLDPEKIRQMKQVFENGGNDSSRSSIHSERQEELSVIARESAKDARNLFKQMEENGFQEHSKRESFYGLENKETFKTTSAMLNLFRRLESQQDYASSSHHSDEEGGNEEEDDEEDGSAGSEAESDRDDNEDGDHNGYGRRSSQQEELLQIAKERALARNLREKFERWEFNDDDEKQMYERNNLMSMNPEQAEEIQASLNTTRNLRAHFENLQRDVPAQTSRPRFKVNRFV